MNLEKKATVHLPSESSESESEDENFLGGSMRRKTKTNADMSELKQLIKDRFTEIESNMYDLRQEMAGLKTQVQPHQK